MRIKKMKIKVGQGYDVHKFKAGRKFILGGIEINYHYGLDGHSDADVLIHAIIDSIVGPALHKDIGNLFPDNDKTYRNIDSKILLKNACGMVRDAGFEIGNVDTTVMAQRPKLAKHIPKMRQAIADVMEIDIDDISIKATTTEKLGFVGREEGIAVHAAALLTKN